MTVSILWLGRIVPIPFNAGDRVYSAQLAAALARQGADVVFLGLENTDDAGADLALLEPRVRWRVVPGLPHSKLASLFSPLPMVGARFATRQYKRAIVQELEASNYDVVVLDQYGMSWALPYVQRFARNRPTLAHIAHNFETKLTDDIARNFAGDFARKFLLKENARKTRLAERQLARRSNLIVTLTEEDRASFSDINPSLTCVVLPPGHAGSKQRVRFLDESVPRRAIIVGSFSWIAKQINLERLLKAASVSFARNGVELHVVGVVPNPLLARLQSEFPWVVFRGFVDDLSEELRGARVALVPEEVGGGFKLKILDYIFSHVPVASVESALSGIPSQLKSHFLIERDVPELLSAVVDVIDDIDRLNAMQKCAFELSEDLFNWDVNGRRLLEGLTNAVGSCAVKHRFARG